MTYKITEYFGETKETIERDATSTEVEDFQAREQKVADLKTEAQTKAKAKADLLDRLGITEDEAKLLLA